MGEIKRTHLRPFQACTRICLPGRESALLLFCAVLLSTVYHWTFFSSGFRLLESNPGDNLLNAFLLEHSYLSFRGMRSWLSPGYFYPDPHVRAYTDLLLGISAIYIPLRAIGLEMFPAVGMTMYLMTFLSFVGCHLVLRKVFTLSLAGSLIGSALFAGAHIRFAQLAHLQLQFTFLNPLLLGSLLLLFFRKPVLTKTKWFLLASAALAGAVLLAATNIYHAFFLTLFSFILVFCALAQKGGRSRLLSALAVRYPQLLAAILPGVVLLAGLLSVFAPVLELEEPRAWSSLTPYLIAPPYLWWMGSDVLLWGWLARFVPDGVENALVAEHRIGFGVLTSLLLLVEVFWQLRNTGAVVKRSFAFALLLCCILPLQLTDTLSLWRFVYEVFPGADGIRAPSRFYLFLLFPASLLVALFFDRVAREKTHPRLLLPLLAALLLFEQLGTAEQFNPAVLLELQKEVEREFASVQESEQGACEAILLVPGADHYFYKGSKSHVYGSEYFPREQYLAQHPDVARNWQGDPFEHFKLYGEDEIRMLSREHASLVNDYQSYNLLASLWLGVPTLAGHSGYWDPSWQLRDLFLPTLSSRVDDWIRKWWREDQEPRICWLPITLGVQERR